MKKGMVIIYDPHSLQQFIWYYCTYASDVKWDALCLPNGYKGTYMAKYCQKAGVFCKIMSSDIDYLNMSLIKKMKLFGEMLGYYLISRREVLCKQILNEYVENIDEYDELACISETGFVSGLMALLGKEKKVSYFDDGLGDYHPRNKWKSPYLKFGFVYLQGLLMAKMGYGCKGRFYFDPTKYCYKYSALTDKMKYRNYREMYDIDYKDTDMKLYNSILEAIYPNLNLIDWERFDTVFFTEDLDDFSPYNTQKYGEKFTEYISENCSAVILKKHPKDNIIYKFSNDILLLEIDNEIPAEVILGYLKDKRIVFSYFSSIIIFMQSYGYEFEIMYIDELFEDNSNSKEAIHEYGSIEYFNNLCDRFSNGTYKITKI